MVLGNSKRSSASDEYYIPAYKHMRQSEDVGIFDIPGALVSGSESKRGISSQHDEGPTLANGCHFSGSYHELEVSRGASLSFLHGSSSPSKDMNSKGEADALLYRDMPDSSHQLVDASQRTGNFIQQDPVFDVRSIKDDETNSSVDADDELERRSPLTRKNSSMSVHKSAWGFPWLAYISNGNRDLDLDSFPGYFEDGHRICRTNKLEDINSPVYEYPYRKLVPVGPNHQADLPELKRPGDVEHSSVLYSSSAVCNESDEYDSHRWFGNCVTLKPDSSVLASEVKLGCRPECVCVDKGSIRCVRQHVMEAREKLKQTLGNDMFRQLGFYDIGEDVAEMWSEEEEQMFEEIILSNPVSFGRNFWNYLPRYFPSRSCKELVSYYFNVFILRKRAQQNRLDPLHADSDNDEWQANVDGESEEEEGSIVESPVKDNITCNGRHEGSSFGAAYDDSSASEGDREQCCDVPNVIKSERKRLHEQVDDRDVQDDSCTSYEAHQNAGDSCGGPGDIQETHYGLVEDHKNMDTVYKNDGLSGLHDSVYDVSHCDMKPWDIGYHCGSSKSVDFLPTCNVIEEVFGKGSWEDSMGGHGVSYEL